MAALEEEDRCLNKNRTLSSSSEPNETLEGGESSNRKRLRDTEPESEDFETIDPHQSNHMHNNPIFQPSETPSLIPTEISLVDFMRDTTNQIVEGDVEMRDRVLDAHALRNLNNGAQGSSANTTCSNTFATAVVIASCS
ncbi:hypothetical protein MKW98_009163 [Papaver atlanticum]|uniref:Uncharacterized protein n=1 Tax=Papaver atlanticum TaxID=357466 RepID=A0AAD4T860_9MAGN|nr:hypothetical protein MKW98_009163 [Papaver atlanticum]